MDMALATPIGEVRDVGDMFKQAVDERGEHPFDGLAGVRPRNRGVR